MEVVIEVDRFYYFFCSPDHPFTSNSGQPASVCLTGSEIMNPDESDTKEGKISNGSTSFGNLAGKLMVIIYVQEGVIPVVGYNNTALGTPQI